MLHTIWALILLLVMGTGTIVVHQLALQISDAMGVVSLIAIGVSMLVLAIKIT
jgi:hypothetical protein